MSIASAEEATSAHAPPPVSSAMGSLARGTAGRSTATGTSFDRVGMVYRKVLVSSSWSSARLGSRNDSSRPPPTRLTRKVWVALDPGATMPCVWSGSKTHRLSPLTPPRL